MGLISRLGYQLYLAPFSPNGKPLHVQGFLSAFNRAAVRSAEQLSTLAGFGIPLVGLDPAMTLVYRQEYLKVPNIDLYSQVALLQEWLLTVLPESPALSKPSHFQLLAHCTEKTNAPASSRQWEQVFERAGLRLTTQATGCCGMSGTYGHESRNKETSVLIFNQSWARQLTASEVQAEVLATGYSWRSQAKRLTDKTLRHPLQALLDVYRSTHTHYELITIIFKVRRDEVFLHAVNMLRGAP